jgi:hypothetical protein
MDADGVSGNSCSFERSHCGTCIIVAIESSGLVFIITSFFANRSSLWQSGPAKTDPPAPVGVSGLVDLCAERS